MHESVLSGKSFFFNPYLVNVPAVLMPYTVFNEICDAAVAAFRMLLDKSLDCLKHLRR
ncbi:MAG: hypothetical protein ABIH76_03160 [Candidatus Bathyarchaeota archaeon]